MARETPSQPSREEGAKAYVATPVLIAAIGLVVAPRLV